MGVLMVVLASVVALLAAFWCYLSWNYGYWKARGVHSINAFSLTGDRGGGFQIGRPFYEMLSPLYDRHKGKHRFVGTFQARTPMLVPLDLDLVKYIMTKEFSSFHSRGLPRSEDDPFSNNLFFLDGPQWKNLRVKLSPVFTSGKLKQMFPLMAGITEKQLSAAVQREATKEDGELDFKEVLLRYSTDVIGSVAFGIDCDSLGNNNEEFLAMTRRIFRINWVALVRFFLVLLHPVFAKLLPFRLLFRDMTDFFLNLMKDSVEQREKNQVERADFVQIMMQVRDEDRQRSALDRANHIEFNNENMSAQAFLLFVAGLDNVANTIGFALHELALNPELQQRVADEVRAAKAKHGAGALTYNAVRAMDLVERVVRESLRKYTPVAQLVRKVTEPIQIPDSGVVLDTSVGVFIPVYQMMRDPELFPEPERFDPERFTPEAREARHPYAYLPFGEGPRFCIAERFAILEMKLCLAGLLDRHVVSVGSKTDLTLKMDPKAGAPTPMAGFWLRVANRPT